MAFYQVFDLQSFGDADEENIKTMIEGFALGECFKEILENYHRDLMAMDFERLMGSGERIWSAFSYITSPEMRNFMLGDMREAIYKKDQEKLIHMHLIFLRKCEILRRELEDYLQTPVPSPNIKECVKECLKVLKEMNDSKVEVEGEVKNNTFCAGCWIF